MFAYFYPKKAIGGRLLIFKNYFFDGHPLYQNITNKSCGFCILKAWFLAPLCAACEMSKLSYFRLKLNNGKPSYCHNSPLPYRTVKINYNSKTLYKYNVFNTNIPLSLIYEHFINRHWLQLMVVVFADTGKIATESINYIEAQTVTRM